MPTALVSVSDKAGLAPFISRLVDAGYSILSTGGTAQHLAENGIEVTEISEYTGFPELFDGRLKTLHPRVHGGLLQRRDDPEHQRQAQQHKVHPIDLVVVNLYPFQETIRQADVSLEKAIEQIDIGGPSMLRSAAKAYQWVTVVCDPADYERVASEVEASDSHSTSLATREQLAIKVFQRTAQYDAAIAAFLNGHQETCRCYSVSLTLDRELRYGENPHQEAKLYGNFSDHFAQLNGKELSYTNVLDIQSAAALIAEFQRPTVAILKHTNPCGVGCDEGDLRAAWEKAFETDRQAPFGGVIALNRPMPLSLARVISEIFTDVIIAPDFEPDARAHLKKKKNLRLIQVNPSFNSTLSDPIIRSAPGGIMVMDPDPVALGLSSLEERVVTQRPPTADEIAAMRFAWKVAKHVKSNAIVFARNDRTLGIGAGQMSRVDAAKIAVLKANEAGLSLDGSTVASDAMFPFPDGLIAAAEAGATSAIQPGGSLRDEMVIEAADRYKMAMAFTDHRHFLH